MWQDIVNGLFCSLAGIAVWNHTRTLLKDKQVKGVSILSTGFFLALGFWSLYYYPHLDQWASFFGGLVITSGNLCWLILMLKYRKK